MSAHIVYVRSLIPAPLALDGEIDSYVQNPIYKYTDNGDYTVTLTIEGPNCQLSMTKKDYIHVSGCGG